MGWLRKIQSLQAACIGLLLGCGFFVSWLWPVGIIGVIYFVKLVIQIESLKSLAWLGWLTFTTKALCALVWFWSVYPIDWLAIDLGNIQLILIFLYWLTASMWLGSAGVFVAWSIKALHRIFRNGWMFLVAVPLAWVLSEVVGSLIFSIITWGEGAVITSAFSFGFTGLLLAGHEWFIFLAYIAGLYGLGYCFVLLSLCAERAWKSKSPHPRLVQGLVLVMVLIGFAPFPATEHQPTEGYSVMTIDTNFSPNQIRTREGAAHIRTELETAVDVALAANPDYLILPEDARFFDQNSPRSQVRARFAAQNEEVETVIVDSGRVLEGADTALRSFVYNGQESLVDSSHKRYLVPQGEFMPYLYTQSLKLAGFNDVVELVARDLAYQVGADTDQSDHADSTPGILFCFESVSPFGVRTLVEERPELPFVAHPVSHSWFHEPDVLWYNLDRMLRVQAIWNQTYIVSAGSQVSGAVYTPLGGVEWLEEVAAGEQWTVSQTVIPQKI